MKKLLTALISAAVIAMPLAVISIPAAAQTATQGMSEKKVTNTQAKAKAKNKAKAKAKRAAAKKKL